MGVDTGLVGQEVLVDGEGGGDGTVRHDLSLDVFNTVDAVAGGAGMLVVIIDAGRVIWASLGASGSDLLDVIARWHGAGDVMGALLHCVVVASAVGTVVSTSDDTLPLEPAPGGADLATVAAHGLALDEVAARGSVGNREEGGEVTAGGDAETIVEGLGGAVSPAGAAVGLVANVVDHGLALGPGGTGVEALGNVVGHEHGVATGSLLNGPVGVNNSAHKILDLLEGGTIELRVDASNPVGVGVGVDGIDVLGEVKGVLLAEEVHDVVVSAELDVPAGLLGLGEVYKLGLVGEEVDPGLELRELSVDGIKLLVLTLGGVIDDGLAELADVVVLGEELVDLASVGDGDEGGDGNRAHSVCNFYYYIPTQYLLHELF